jgi:hypothetical protein
MIVFPKQITSHFVKYTSSLSVEDFLEEIKNLLDSTTNSDTNINLEGKFINADEFELTRQWGELTINPFRKLSLPSPHSRTTIKGFVFKNELNQTQVNLVVIPNSVFQISILILLFIFLLVTYEMIAENLGNLLHFGIILVIVMISYLILGISAHLKRKLLKTIVNLFDLQKF